MRKTAALLVLLMIVFALSSCEGKSINGGDEPQLYEGGLGEAMNTYFFDFTVNSAALTGTYGDVTLNEGTFLVANVTVKNTADSTISMYDTDFQAQWGDEADEAYSYPITWEYEDGLLDEMRQFPSEYELEPGESRTGELVYIVPEGRGEYSISYEEIFSSTEGETVEGDVFFVFFRP